MKNDAAAATAYTAPSHADIARRAFEIYLERGGQDGHHEADWLEAERQLSGTVEVETRPRLVRTRRASKTTEPAPSAA